MMRGLSGQGRSGDLIVGSVAIVTTVLLAFVLLPGFRQGDVPLLAPTAAYDPEPLAIDVGEPIFPLVAAAPTDPARTAIGGRLFHDPRLSADGKVACASCHDTTAGGADTTPLSHGVEGRQGRYNAPSVFNTVFNFRQYWDGRSANLRVQVDGPLLGRNEMAAEWDKVLALLQSDPGYARAFAAAYPDGVTADNARDAIVMYQRSLAQPGAPFDRWLLGDRGAISAEAARGYELFKALGCTACHQGAGIGGNMYQRMGLLEDYFAFRGSVAPTDLGRFNVTGREEDRYVFKVPSLRNVAQTAPYFHDGSVATLEEAVRIMARFQLGREIADADAALLVAFLQTLTAPRPPSRPPEPTS